MTFVRLAGHHRDYGTGNADCGTLPLAALDLAGGWANYHRPKTGISGEFPGRFAVSEPAAIISLN
jgi:hypothetical protein